MRVSKVVREYIEKTLREPYTEAVKNDPTIKRWEDIKKEKNALLSQLKAKYKEQFLKEIAPLGYEEDSFVLDVYERGFSTHPAQKAADDRKEELYTQYRDAVDDIVLELELGGASKKDLADMMAKVTFGE